MLPVVKTDSVSLVNTRYTFRPYWPFLCLLPADGQYGGKVCFIYWQDSYSLFWLTAASMSILKRYISQRDVFYTHTHTHKHARTNTHTRMHKQTHARTNKHTHTTCISISRFILKSTCDRKAVRYSWIYDNCSCLKMVEKCRKHGASCYILKKGHLNRLSERLTQALTITAMCLCTGLGLPPDYLGSRALTELQPPPSTIGSSEFPFSIDGEYLTVCYCYKHHLLL